ncbi:hypothetical protein E4T56_gene13320 [Termitomyces sp. T112]|nr:hypothetical protein E4T56_gene13320 [Termitomyces sp. T112]
MEAKFREPRASDSEIQSEGLPIMLPNTQASSSLSGYAPAVQSGFPAGPAFPNQPGFISSEQNLHQGTDPNSPASFHQNLQIVQEHVARLQNLARNTLSGIQNAYHPGNSLVQTQANLGTLKEEIEELSQLMLRSGVGALPLLPIPAPGETMSPPTEQQLLAEVNDSIRSAFEQMKRSQDSASVVANLLGAPDRISNGGFCREEQALAFMHVQAIVRVTQRQASFRLSPKFLHQLPLPLAGLSARPYCLCER